jgi:hypothetical protein
MNVGSRVSRAAKSVLRRGSKSFNPLFMRLDVSLISLPEDYGRVLLGNTEVQEALMKLNELTNEENLVTAATTLVVVQGMAAEVGAGACFSFTILYD